MSNLVKALPRDWPKTVMTSAALPFDRAHTCQAAAPVKGQKGACGVGDAGCTVRCHKRAEAHQICQELQRRCMEQDRYEL